MTFIQLNVSFYWRMKCEAEKWAQKYHKTPLKFIFVSSLLRWETRLCRLEHFKVSLLNSKKCNTFSSPQAIKKCEFKHHKVRQHDTWRRFWQRRDCWCRMNWYFIVIILLLTRKLHLCLHQINNNTLFKSLLLPRCNSTIIVDEKDDDITKFFSL